jgi:hypothetical protein
MARFVVGTAVRRPDDFVGRSLFLLVRQLRSEYLTASLISNKHRKLLNIFRQPIAPQLRSDHYGELFSLLDARAVGPPFVPNCFSPLVRLKKNFGMFCALGVLEPVFVHEVFGTDAPTVASCDNCNNVLGREPINCRADGCQSPLCPKSDQTQRRNEMTRCARNGLMREVSVLGAPDGLEAT